MFNFCLRASVFLSCWKVAKFVLVNKKQGNLEGPSIYRSLRMLDTVKKMF